MTIVQGHEMRIDAPLTWRHPVVGGKTTRRERESVCVRREDPIDENCLLANLLKASINISHSCGGQGTCGTCRILVRSGVEDLPPRNTIENEMAVARGFAANERLSCQLPNLKDLEFDIP